MNGLPRSALDTNDLDLQSRYEQWRDSFSVGFGYDLKPGIARDQFRGRIENTLFDQIMLTQFRASAARYERSAARIARDGVDMLMLQLYLDGPGVYDTRTETRGCAIGDLIIMDMSQPIHSQHEAQHNLTLSFPRALLAHALPAFEDAHLRVLPADSPVNHVLRSHMLTLQSSAGQFTNETAQAMLQPTLALGVAAIRAVLGVTTPDSGPLKQALRARADKVIEQSLPQLDLTPERIALAVPCSRSRLYALYQNEGGVAAYIQRRRLHAVLRDLISPDNRMRTIGVIADQWGYRNMPSFNRAFKTAFGFTPSEARSQAYDTRRTRTQTSSDAHPDSSRAYESWVREVLSSP